MGAYDTYGVSDLTLSPTTYCGSPPPSYVSAESTTISIGGDDDGAFAADVAAITVTWYSTPFGGEPLPGVTAVDTWNKPVPLSDEDVEAALAVYARLTGWDGTY